LTQTRPFPPPATGVAFARGFAGFAAAAAGAGVLVTAGALGAVACFLLNESAFDGVGLGAAAVADGVAFTVGIAFLWLRFFAGAGEDPGATPGVGLAKAVVAVVVVSAACSSFLCLCFFIGAGETAGVGLGATL
jgi:hypothetical protein